MGFGFGFNLGPLRWGGSFRGGGGSGEALLYLIIAGFVVMAFRPVFEFIAFCVVILSVHVLSAYLMWLAEPKAQRSADFFGFFLFSFFTDCVLAMLGFVFVLFDNWLTYTQAAVIYLGWRVVVISPFYVISLFDLLDKKFVLTKWQRDMVERDSGETYQEYVRRYFLISANPCSRCGGEVRRNKKKFVISCAKCNYEHSYLHYPDLVDASFQPELERLELEQKQREIERRLEEDRQAKVLAEHQLRLRAKKAWREEIRSAVNDVDVEVRKVLNPSPGDIVDEVALRHVFKAAEKSLEVTDSRLEQKDEYTNYLTTQKRVLEDLMTAIKSQTGLDLSGIDPATIENSGA
jgi:hypothetical protein